jgi:hypothetical protein
MLFIPWVDGQPISHFLALGWAQGPSPGESARLRSGPSRFPAAEESLGELVIYIALNSGTEPIIAHRYVAVRSDTSLAGYSCATLSLRFGGLISAPNPGTSTGCCVSHLFAWFKKRHINHAYDPVCFSVSKSLFSHDRWHPLSSTRRGMSRKSTEEMRQTHAQFPLSSHSAGATRIKPGNPRWRIRVCSMDSRGC